MPTKKWCVRVVWFQPGGGKDKSGLLIEQLRYAGIVRVHGEDEPMVSIDGIKVPAKGNDTVTHWKRVFDLHAPSKVDSKTWADMNSRRMQSFGILASAAPEAY